jgi:hypothetical protein
VRTDVVIVCPSLGKEVIEVNIVDTLLLVRKLDAVPWQLAENWVLGLARLEEDHENERFSILGLVHHLGIQCSRLVVHLGLALGVEADFLDEILCPLKDGVAPESLKNDRIGGTAYRERCLVRPVEVGCADVAFETLKFRFDSCPSARWPCVLRSTVPASQTPELVMGSICVSASEPASA